MDLFRTLVLGVKVPIRPLRGVHTLKGRTESTDDDHASSFLLRGDLVLGLNIDTSDPLADAERYSFEAGSNLGVLSFRENWIYNV